MKKAKVALGVLLASTVALAAQDAPRKSLPSPPRAIEVQAAGGAILSFRPRSKTTVQLVSPAGAPFASGEVEVDSRARYAEIKLGRGDIQGLHAAGRWGRDFLAFVLWVVPLNGAAMNAGEIRLRDGRTQGISVSTPYHTFWLLVTAEPSFAVHQPSPAVVLVSQDAEQTRAEGKAVAVPGPLRYYTHYTHYDTTPAGERSPGVPPDLRQARHAIALAAGVNLLDISPPAERELLAGEKRARELLEQARTYLAQAERHARGQGNIRALQQSARTATQMAENARALALGVVGGSRIRHLRTEAQSLRAARADTASQLRSLRKRFSELEATLDLERARTRDLEGQLLALRERVVLLEDTLEGAREETARLSSERDRLCEELRRQLASIGRLSQEGNRLALSLAADDFFDKRNELRPAARESLAKLAAFHRLLFSRAPVRFEGHTDLVGDPNYNQWLSEQRALAVYRFFLEEQLAQSELPDEQTVIEERLEVVARLLGMSYNTARRQAARRQEWLALLGNAVAGKGMREPLVPVEGASPENRRVTLIFPQASGGGLGWLCPAASSVQ